MKGTRVAHYQVGPLISRGGMGDVYRAEDTRLERSVAIKFLPEEPAADPTVLSRFHREAKLASSLNHPNICTVHDTGEFEGRPYIVMELLEGTPLVERAADGPLKADEILKVATDVTEALDAAHQAGLVHRDIKPSNLFLTQHGHVKVVDFGIAKDFRIPALGTQVETALTGQGGFIGTVDYASPEQIAGDLVDQRSDLFSLGIVLYELSTGRHPFRRSSRTNTIQAVLRDAVIPPHRYNRQIPVSLSRIIVKLLERDIGRRYQRAGSLLSDLSGVAIPPAKSWTRRAVIAAVPLAAVALGIFWLSAPPAKIAVLPFSYEGPEQWQHLAGRAVPTALTDALQSVEGLEVAPFVASSRLAASDDISTMAQKLGVDWIVRGDLRVEGSDYLAQLELVQAAGLEPGWKGEFQGTVNEYWVEAPYMASSLSRILGVGGLFGSGDTSDSQQEAIRLYLKGKRHLDGWDVEKNAQRAEEAFRDAISISEELAEAHAGLALALCLRWRETIDAALLEEAEVEANRAVLLRPGLAEAHLARASVHLEKRNFKEAEAAALNALMMTPEDDSAARSVAQAHAGLGKAEEAERMFVRAIELGPEDWQNYNETAKFYLRQGELDQAKRYFRDSISHRPESPVPYSNLASLHIMDGNFAEALPLLNAAVQIQPDAAGYNNLGTGYYHIGQFGKAAEQFQAAAEQNPNQVEPWVGLGDAYRQLNMNAEALQAYRRASDLSRAKLAVTPRDPATRTALALSLACSGQCSDARAQFAQLGTDEPLDAAISYQWAVIFSVCGDLASARKQIAAAKKGGLGSYVESNPDLQAVLSGVVNE